GQVFSHDRRSDKAIEALKRAVELDPDFALAWRSLGLIYSNIGLQEEAQRCFDRAFELAERLPPKQRVPILADHFGNRWATLSKSIDIYEEGLKLYPRQISWHNNLGYTYAQVERYGEALEEYETSIALGTRFGYAHVNRSFILLALGRAEEAVQALEAFADAQPGRWSWRANLGWLKAAVGDLDAGLAELERADSLTAEPQELLGHYRSQVHALRGEWSLSDLANRDLAGVDQPRARRLAAVADARNHLFHGRSADALESLRRARRIATEAGQWPETVYVLLAQLHLHRGEPDLALDAAREAQRLDPDGWYGRRGIFFEALAQEALGRPGAADEKLARLAEHAGQGQIAERRLALRLEGRLAASRGQARAAQDALRGAAELLSPRGVIFDAVRPSHVALWLELGLAAEAAGDAEGALRWIDAATSAGVERLDESVAWTRSLYHLARLLDAAGRSDEAIVARRRFHDLRRDGDLDPQWIEAARIGAAPGE
ncbi:MAG: tetratricopeptide repeat protein, partial [Acidobacteriota bacterium]